MPLFEKKSNAPSGTVTVSVDNVTVVFHDGEQVSVTDPDVISYLLSGSASQIQLVGGQSLYVPPRPAKYAVYSSGEAQDGDGLVYDQTNQEWSTSSITRGGASVAGFVRKLQEGTENAVLSILTDSTGNPVPAGDPRWPTLLASWFGSNIAVAYTIVEYQWILSGDSTTGSYSAPTTIVDRGVGAPVLSIYNGSGSGKTTDWWITNLALGLPTQPDLVLTSLGHNESDSRTATYRRFYLALTDAIQSLWPSTRIAVIAQNPRSSDGSGGSTGAANHRLRQARVVELAETEGFGVIDVMRAFIEDGRPLSTLLADGTHPSSDAGSPLYLSTITSQLLAARHTEPLTPRLQRESVTLGPGVWAPFSGAPELKALGGSRPPGWAMDPDTEEGITAAVEIPRSWITWRWQLLWAVAATPVPAAVRYAVGQTPIVDGQVASNASVVTGTSTIPATNTISVSEFGSGGTAYSTTSRSTFITIRRLATDGADTYTGDAWFLGLRLIRMT